MKKANPLQILVWHSSTNIPDLLQDTSSTVKVGDTITIHTFHLLILVYFGTSGKTKTYMGIGKFKGSGLNFRKVYTT